MKLPLLMALIDVLRKVKQHIPQTYLMFDCCHSMR